MSSKLNILRSAVRLAESEGFTNITRDGVATAARVACGLINYHFKTMDDLRDAIIQYAVDESILTLIAQGIVYGHPIAVNAPDGIKLKALQSQMG